MPSHDRSPTPIVLRRTLLALGIGAAGAAVAVAVNLPLAMLLGPLLATLVASLAGAHLVVPNRLRSVLQVVIGAFLASKFTPEILTDARAWPASLALVPVYIVATTAVGALYLRQVAGLDRATAAFASIPGGLVTMAAIGGSFGGDERRISIAHSLRIGLTVLGVAIAFGLWGESPDREQQLALLMRHLDADPLQLAITAAFAALGVIGAFALRIPIPWFLGPLLTLSPLYLSGYLQVQIPGPLLAIALWGLGSSIGSRFRGFGWQRLLSSAGHSVISLLLALMLSAAVAAILSATLGLPFAVVFLAFAPGGVAEMSIIALAMDINPAFVTVHHFLRIAFCSIAAPFAARRLQSYTDPG